ncbi:MAG: hypothetical protein D6812_07190 [Deltaproteobacteria bacterium]|nr:MAG: hypothetical protein D6812_07190 [Deltaproteobacteria bacterium]
MFKDYKPALQSPYPPHVGDEIVTRAFGGNWKLPPQVSKITAEGVYATVSSTAEELTVSAHKIEHLVLDLPPGSRVTIRAPICKGILTTNPMFVELVPWAPKECYQWK